MNLIMIILDNSIIFHIEPGWVRFVILSSEYWLRLVKPMG